MDIEKTSIVLRERGVWESVDLGYAMVRHFWRPLWSGWLITVACVAGTLGLILSSHPVLAGFVFWWLKPMLDRVPLLILSRSVFGETTRPRSLLGALPTLFSRSLLDGLFSSRLSPWRSYVLPIKQLEGLRGAAKGRRMQIIMREGVGAAVGLTLGGLAAEWAFWLGLYTFIDLLTPSGGAGIGMALTLPSEADRFIDPWGMTVAYWLTVTFLEPFYVSAGFALYLSRRVGLEGWDLELALRRLAKRLASRAATATLIIVCGVGALAAPCWASELSGGAPVHDGALREAPPGALAEMSGGEVDEAIFEILRDDIFGRWEKRRSWRLKPDPAPAEPNKWDFDILAGLSRFLADIIPGILAVVLIALILYVVAAMLMKRSPSVSGAVGGGSPPQARVRTGAPVDLQSLPLDVIAGARSAFFAGQHEQALSLLYRGALAQAVSRSAVPLPQGATEGECLRWVQRNAVSMHSDFRGVLHVWMRCAYGNEVPSTGEFLDLCALWQGRLGGTES